MKSAHRILGLLAVFLLVTSCSKTYVTRVENIAPKPVTEHYLSLGKAAYKSCRFGRALEYLSQALAGELSGHQQAEAYTFMAASFYYEGDVPTARAYMIRARTTSSSFRPSAEDFPAEIRELVH